MPSSSGQSGALGSGKNAKNHFIQFSTYTTASATSPTNQNSADNKNSARSVEVYSVPSLPTTTSKPSSKSLDNKSIVSPLMPLEQYDFLIFSYDLRAFDGVYDDLVRWLGDNLSAAAPVEHEHLNGDDDLELQDENGNVVKKNNDEQTSDGNPQIVFMWKYQLINQNPNSSLPTSALASPTTSNTVTNNTIGDSLGACAVAGGIPEVYIQRMHSFAFAKPHVVIYTRPEQLSSLIPVNNSNSNNSNNNASSGNNNGMNVCEMLNKGELWIKSDLVVLPSGYISSLSSAPTATATSTVTPTTNSNNNYVERARKVMLSQKYQQFIHSLLEDHSAAGNKGNVLSATTTTSAATKTTSSSSKNTSANSTETSNNNSGGGANGDVLSSFFSSLLNRSAASSSNNTASSAAPRLKVEEELKKMRQ